MLFILVTFSSFLCMNAGIALETSPIESSRFFTSKLYPLKNFNSIRKKIYVEFLFQQKSVFSRMETFSKKSGKSKISYGISIWNFWFSRLFWFFPIFEKTLFCRNTNSAYIFFQMELKFFGGYSFDVKNRELSIGDVSRAILAFLHT